MPPTPHPAKQTPLMQQYATIKAKHPHTLLLFRVGDFYETFYEDAHTLHKVADIKLTKRANGAAAAVALAGFPHHALDLYLAKLLQAGYRVAVCDQMEPPKKGKTIVRRAVTELATPGLTYHDHVLHKKQNNYLASLHFGTQAIGLAFLDISTGEFLLTQGEASHINKLLQSFQPSEVLFSKKQQTMFEQLIQATYPTYALDEWIYTTTYAERKLNEHFGTQSLKGFGIAKLPQGIIAAGAIMRYLAITEHHHVQHIVRLARIDASAYMWLDPFTVRNLELLKAQEEGGVALIDMLDQTVTPMGARLLKKWLLFPLKEAEKIHIRQRYVDFFFQHGTVTRTLREQLSHVGDLQRLVAKVASKRINPRELQLLHKALQLIAPMRHVLQPTQHAQLAPLHAQLDPCTPLVEKISHTLQETPPLHTTQGGLIKQGVSQTLDELRSIALESNLHLQKIQDSERQRTGIASLKIGYNKVFGYYLEVTHTHKAKVPPTWLRKQTLVHAERYITEELKHYEEKILYAQERMHVVEQQLYEALVQTANKYIPQIQQNAHALATLDSYLSLAYLAGKNNYVRPQITPKQIIDIHAGRHPVIEQHLPVGQTYVANDTYLDSQEQILLITGPNMAGKSALLRQVGLIVLMAQIGSFVPAQQAIIGIHDKLFTRVGAHDNLANQESTFMVEMNEMASILHNLSERSLVLIDELGRGTGTADGLALAESILRYLQRHPTTPAHTLFATHYHELNKLSSQFSTIKNYHVRVKQQAGRLLFLHQLAPGGSEHSFGIHVAQMAGMPPAIIACALRLLQQSNKAPTQPSENKTTPFVPTLTWLDQQPLWAPLLQELKRIDTNTLTPIQALMKLNELKTMLPKASTPSLQHLGK